MEAPTSIQNSIFLLYPETQWILVGTLMLSIILQLLFYIYFFCSFKRNYSSNLTLNSFRKQNLSITDDMMDEDYDEGAADAPSKLPHISLASRAESVRYTPKDQPRRNSNEEFKNRKKSESDVEKDFLKELEQKVGKQDNKVSRYESNKMVDLTSSLDLDQQVRTIKSPVKAEVKILNEKREISNSRRARRTRHRLQKAKISEVSHKESVVAKHKPKIERRSSPAVDLYEVYFNENGMDRLHQKTKTNIQKIKFKRRSPSLESH